MTLQDYVRILRVHWLAIVVLVVVGSGCAYGWSLLQPRVYQANSSGIVSLISDNTMGATIASDALAKSKATTFVGVGESRAVAQQVITALGLATTPEALVNQITITQYEGHPDPERHSPGVNRAGGQRSR
ncbi:YveK family protein [Subtercola frigoramans]|uniref:Uncharacterized protein involved in exopolysaccharide biosynthesis n=1 Tax=Subtercola frigoramans TaxID=120298 RepID=A0ABS2L8I1_9MICO|nr:hypothetical protein [Subtercola frigoramans]MBM7473384.1 uncharacterized protein involved in exopolysaccharide biosynthesis [Subtercola frigoramans]